MRALVLGAGGVALHDAAPMPVPGEGETLVRVLRAGVCATDLELIRGYKGFQGVLGHEFVGIAQSGPYQGRRVVGEINCSCWRCSTCAAGRPSHCPNRSVIGILNHDGAFADYVAVPQRNLHVVPDTISNDEAVFTEPLAAALQIPAQISVRRDERVIVLGDGRLGNLCAQVLARLTDHLLVVGKHASKLGLLNAQGIRTALLSEVGANAAVDIVVDATGSDSGLTTALRLVRPRGTVVLKTTVAGSQTLALAPVVVDEVTVVGSRCGPFDQALALLASGGVSVAPLISSRFELSRGPEALAAAASQLKVLIDVHD
ncbi:MAG: 2-deoxy-scyllo-inosamine dehydrogenase [Acidobacteriota bacterium]|jgi:threonine dehydrogenase-like Zn-dependent dehydrogenase